MKTNHHLLPRVASSLVCEVAREVREVREVMGRTDDDMCWAGTSLSPAH